MLRYLIPIFLFAISLYGTEAPFIYVVIPSYNNEAWCIKNIESIVSQDYTNWKAVVINDCSEDRTGHLLESFVMQKALSHKIKIIHNPKRKGMLANIYSAVRRAKPEWVIATVDGDDWLRGNHALSSIASLYKNNPNIWMTYGSWVSDPAGARPCNCKAFPEKVIKKNSFRKHPYISSQLRTFYAALFQRIRKKDLQTQGKFFMAAGDAAFMIPMLEMASKGHFHYVTEPLYAYNVTNPISDFRAHVALRDKCVKKIRKKPPYTPLKTLSLKKIKKEV